MTYSRTHHAQPPLDRRHRHGPRQRPGQVELLLAPLAGRLFLLALRLEDDVLELLPEKVEADENHDDGHERLLVSYCPMRAAELADSRPLLGTSQMAVEADSYAPYCQ